MATKDATTNYSTKTEDYRALYDSYLQHVNSRNFEAMEPFFASPMNINDEPWDPENGAGRFKSLLDAFRDLHWEKRYPTMEGDHLAVHLKVTGTHRGSFQGIEATRRKITISQFTLYHVVDGHKFGHVWDLIDIASIMRQIS